MAYEKQGFHSGEKLKASQLSAMEDGIIEADANMRKGTGENATQQLPDGVAEGFDFTGKNPIAEGIDNTLSAVQPYGATGEFAAAFGGKTNAQGRRAFACGTTTIAKGKYSFAAGENTVAFGNSSFAEGMQTTSVGYAAHAQNGLTVAYGDSSHAQNYITAAVGDYSTATGVETVAEGIASFTAGRGTIATVDSQMVVGRYNEESKDLFVVGAGTDKDNPHTAFSVGTNGNVKINVGNYNEEAKDLFVVGTVDDKNIPYRAFSIGTDGSVKVDKSPKAYNEVVRLVDLNTLNSKTTAINSTQPTNAIYQSGGSEAIGNQAAAFNKGKANGEQSIAFNQATASNTLAFAAGTNTEASGYGATAFGVNTVSKNAYGFTTGEGTQTGKDCQTVVGKYNLGTQGLFEVGCGTAANRFNGLAVHPDGYLIIRRADGQYYNLNLILDALNGWVDNAKI